MTSCSHPSPIKTREPYLCCKHLRCEKTPWPGRVFSGETERRVLCPVLFSDTHCCGINTHTYTYSELERAKWNNAKEEPQSPYITGNGRVLAGDLRCQVWLPDFEGYPPTYIVTPMKCDTFSMLFEDAVCCFVMWEGHLNISGNYANWNWVSESAPKGRTPIWGLKERLSRRVRQNFIIC